jgi:hypothetical protein
MALVQHEPVVDLAAHRKGRMISDGILTMDW